MKLNKLKTDLIAAKKAFKAAAGQDLSDEDFDALEANVQELDAAIAKEESRLKRVDAHTGGDFDIDATADPVDNPKITKVQDQWQKDPSLGYSRPGVFLEDVMNAEMRGSVSPQLKFLAAAGSDEHSTLSNTYGGFLIPEAFRPEVLSVSAESDPTASRVTQLPMASDVVNIPARTDKNHTSSVSGGLSVGRTTETQSPDASRLQLENVKLEATALMGLSYASEQLLERSAVSFIALLESGFSDEFASKMFDEKINGTGAGAPVGILDAAATISVAKEGGQTADTITGQNLIDMRHRAWRYGNSIWLANHDVYPSLVTAHVTMTNDDIPVFIPGNGIDVPDTVLGRPIYFTEYAKTLGDKGDIMLCDWSQYLWGTLGGGSIQSAESMHVRFVNHERTFKFYTYNTGSPWWKSALTPMNSSTTLSPFVTLAARA
jgi:HK97 family phage major capsid protein